MAFRCAHIGTIACAVVLAIVGAWFGTVGGWLSYANSDSACPMRGAYLDLLFIGIPVGVETVC